MANICMILGKSGTGKSTSIKTLKPEETVVVNLLNKKLPFKGSAKMYSTEKKNMFKLSEYQDIVSLIGNISSHATHVKTVIIDDMIYMMRKEYFKRAKESGYGKYTELAMHFQNVVQACEQAREDLNIFFILHSEDVQSDKVHTGFKVSTIGNLLDTQYNPIEVVPMVLYSNIRYNDKGEPEYGFYTNKFKEGAVEIPAKSPEGMFEDLFIPNDLEYVTKIMNEYYG